MILIGLIFWPEPELKGVLLYLELLTGLGTLAAIIQILAYLVKSFRLINAYGGWVKDNFSYLEKVNLMWLRVLLPVLATLWGLYLFSALFSESFGVADASSNLLHFSIVLAIYGLGIMALIQPRVFTRLRKSRKPAAMTVPPGKADESPIEENKYQKSALSAELAESILSRLKTVIKSNKPYLNSNLTLPVLAKQVSTSPHYLSQVINEKLGMNFFDFINSHRVEEAKRLLLNPPAHTSSILDIAMEVAFNSKSAFYSAFKKHTGKTPLQYQKENRPA